MSTLKVDVTFEEWNDFVESSKEQMTPRLWDDRWVGVFTTNSRGKEWSFTRWGNTPLNERPRLRGIRFVEQLKQEYLAHIDGRGGRVFVNGIGAYYKTDKGKPVLFAVFRFPRIRIPIGPAPADEAAANL
jgi:hypothetical protein